MGFVDLDSVGEKTPIFLIPGNQRSLPLVKTDYTICPLKSPLVSLGSESPLRPSSPNLNPSLFQSRSPTLSSWTSLSDLSVVTDYLLTVSNSEVKRRLISLISVLVKVHLTSKFTLSF